MAQFAEDKNSFAGLIRDLSSWIWNDDSTTSMEGRRWKDGAADAVDSYVHDANERSPERCNGGGHQLSRGVNNGDGMRRTLRMVMDIG